MVSKSRIPVLALNGVRQGSNSLTKSSSGIEWVMVCESSLRVRYLDLAGHRVNSPLLFQRQPHLEGLIYSNTCSVLPKGLSYC